MNPSNPSREKVIWAALVPQMVLLIISILWIYSFPKDNVIVFFQFKIKFLLIGLLTGLIIALLGYGFYRFAQKTKTFHAAIELFEEHLAPVFKNLRFIDLILLSTASGFCEEIFFRGLLLPKIGIILSSLAFGLLHLPGRRFWIYALWASLSGALFGFLFLTFNSLWIPITAHATNNIIGMMLLKRLEK